MLIRRKVVWCQRQKIPLFLISSCAIQEKLNIRHTRVDFLKPSVFLNSQMTNAWAIFHSCGFENTSTSFRFRCNSVRVNRSLIKTFYKIDKVKAMEIFGNSVIQHILDENFTYTLSSSEWNLLINFHPLVIFTSSRYGFKLITPGPV